MYFIADIMNGVPINSDSIDLVVADPPFNIKLMVNLVHITVRNITLQAIRNIQKIYLLNQQKKYIVY